MPIKDNMKWAQGVEIGMNGTHKELWWICLFRTPFDVAKKRAAATVKYAFNLATKHYCAILVHNCGKNSTFKVSKQQTMYNMHHYVMDMYTVHNHNTCYINLYIDYQLTWTLIIRI